MKIEELFETTKPIRSSFLAKPCQSHKKTLKNKTNSKTQNERNKTLQPHTVPPKSRSQTGAKRRNSQSKMRLEDVNRHEENSFLLEAETNQAILDNAICKNELCRYLTPLKFIEIDTWRKDVPYGLGQDKESERRKWKTPQEILSRIAADQKTETPNYVQNSFEKSEKNSSRNPKRQTLQVLNAQDVSTKRINLPEQIGDQKGVKSGESYEKMEITSNNRLEKTDEKLVDKNNTPRNGYQRRPATSPERQTILTKIRGEKILARRQNSPQTSPKVKDYSRMQSEKESKVQSSYGNFQFPAGLYNRSSLSPVASPRKTTTSTFAPATRLQTTFQENQEALKNPTYKYMPMEYRNATNPCPGRTYSAVKSQFYADLSQVKKMTQSSFRPRTRGGERREFTDPLTTILNENTTLSPKTLRKSLLIEEKQDKSHTMLLDPNIAYIPPQIPRKSNTGLSGDKVKNYYAKAAKQHGLIASPTGNSEVANTELIPNDNKAKIQEAVHLPQTSLFSTNQTIPRINSFSPREITTSEMHTQRSWNSLASFSTHPSPWVSQALPDFTKSEVISKAERDGYYVRKPSKAVSFRLGEGVTDSKPLHRGYKTDANSSPNNISMVVVNVDEPGDSKKLLPRGGAIGITGKANGFVGVNAIPVRP